MSDDGFESTIEEFVELEDELTTTGGATVGAYESGTVAGASKVAADEVPEDYPLDAETEHVLELDVEIDDGVTLPTYLPWPEPGTEADEVKRLLDRHGYGPGEFAELYGTRVALESEEGWHRIALDDASSPSSGSSGESAASTLDRPSGYEGSLGHSGKAVAGAVGVGTLGYVLAFLFTETEAVFSVASLLLLLGWVAIPLAVFYDLRSVKETLDWDTSTGTWVAGCLVPLFNPAVGLAYLVDRHVRASGVGEGQISDVWYKAAIFGAVAPIVGLALTPLSAGLGAVVWSYSIVLLPLAIYFDAEYVEDATDWDPNEEAWAIVAFLAAWTIVGGTLVGGVYLARRASKLD